jgi:hypothetical protein
VTWIVPFSSRVPLFAVFLLSLSGGSAAAQDLEPPDVSSAIEEKAFVIVASTTSHSEAVKVAALAAQEFDWKVDLRGLSEDRTIGLTYSRAVCEENSWDFPCYLPRGRFDDGVWVSVEYSSAYEGFPPGLYIVVAAGGEVANPAVPDTLDRVRERFPRALVQRATVYLGCLH